MSDRPEGFAIVPNWLVRDGSIPVRVKAVFMVLSSHTGRDGTWWMGHQQIAREAGLSVSSVQRSLADLRDMGLVTWDARVTERGDRAENAYRLAVLTGGSGHSDRGVHSPGPGGPVTVTEQQEEPEEEPQEEPEQTSAPAALTLALPDPMDQQFQEFWDAYPRHTDRAKAEAAFRRARKRYPLSLILGGVERLVAERRDPQFIPHPTTWLNGRRWEDEPVAASRAARDREAFGPQWADGSAAAGWEAVAGPRNGVAR